MNNELPQLEYEKLSDDLYYMGDYVLKFCVDLARKDKDNKRVHFHKEYRYDTNKYINCNKLVTLKLLGTGIIAENLIIANGLLQFTALKSVRTKIL